MKVQVLHSLWSRGSILLPVRSIFFFVCCSPYHFVDNISSLMSMHCMHNITCFLYLCSLHLRFLFSIPCSLFYMRNLYIRVFNQNQSVVGEGVWKLGEERQCVAYLPQGNFLPFLTINLFKVVNTWTGKAAWPSPSFPLCLCCLNKRIMFVPFPLLALPLPSKVVVTHGRQDIHHVAPPSCNGNVPCHPPHQPLTKVNVIYIA